MASEDTTQGFLLPPVRNVPMYRAFAWLKRGWHDYWHAAWHVSAAHGLLAATFGLLLIVFARGNFYLLAGAFTGFLLVGPILCTGLYEVSRRLERGEHAGFAEAIEAWKRGTRPLVGLGLILAVIGTFWVMLSAVLLALFVHEPIIGLEGFLRHVVLSQGSYLFIVWLALGGLVASLVFAGCAISVPLMLDREIDLHSAILTSVQAVAINPIAMAIWATLIMGLTLLGMALLMVGLIPVVPVIGHATWYAYREMVDVSGIPERN